MAITSITSPSSEVSLNNTLNNTRVSDQTKTYQSNQHTNNTASIQNKPQGGALSDSVNIQNAQEFLKEANNEVVKPDLLKPENQLLTKTEQDEKNPKKPEDLNKTLSNGESLVKKGSVIFEYDTLSKSAIVKFLDMKGNVISQVPPEQYLKTLQMSGGNPEGEKGTLLNKKV